MCHFVRLFSETSDHFFFSVLRNFPKRHFETSRVAINWGVDLQ